jgi:hypothetical protein
MIPKYWKSRITDNQSLKIRIQSDSFIRNLGLRPRIRNHEELVTFDFSCFVSEEFCYDARHRIPSEKRALCI